MLKGTNVSKETTVYKVFVVSITFTVLLVLSGVFLGISIKTRQLIYAENLTQARALFNSIVLARRWNAGYEGVYVRKSSRVVATPFIKNPDIRSADGAVYTLRNPAIMTREISELAARGGLFRFHITSLKLTNPENKPDDFERESLNSFQNGAVESYKIVSVDGRSHFRYMAPLYIEAGCLACHDYQGYKAGDIRGGISVTFDIEQMQQKLTSNTRQIAFFGITTTALLLGLFYLFTLRLIKKVSEARKQIEHLAITDPLTGLFNRRHVMARFDEEFQRANRLGRGLCAILLDIDHFKAVNDTRGHLVGDEVLKEVARRIISTVREYDIAGRYGGEEFVIVAPDTDIEQAGMLAERVRGVMRGKTIEGLHITASLGVAKMQSGDVSTDDMIKRADDALYRAKRDGRDTVRQEAI